MKKTITSLILALVVLTLSACNGNTQPPEETIAEATTTLQAEMSTEITTAKVTETTITESTDFLLTEFYGAAGELVEVPENTEFEKGKTTILNLDYAYAKSSDGYFVSTKTNPELFVNGEYIGEKTATPFEPINANEGSNNVLLEKVNVGAIFGNLTVNKAKSSYNLTSNSDGGIADIFHTVSQIELKGKVTLKGLLLKDYGKGDITEDTPYDLVIPTQY